MKRAASKSVLLSVLILLCWNTRAQSSSDEQKICQEAAQQLVTEFGPSRATPEMYSPPTGPTGDSKKGIPTLPEGNDPVGPRVRRLETQRGNLAEMRAEACFKFAVEIGRHYGLALDGKESYARLQQIKEEKAKDLARQISRPASCVVPGTSVQVAEGETKCLVNSNPALCPMCESGFRHTCVRIDGSNDAQWVKATKCLESEKNSAKRLAENTSPGFNELFAQQQSSVEQGYQARQQQEAAEELLSQQPTVVPQSYVNPNAIPKKKDKPRTPYVDPCPSCQTVR